MIRGVQLVGQLTAIYVSRKLITVFTKAWHHLYLTFRGPCIVIHKYNGSQQDALFLNFILINNSTCFGQTYCPSSGVLILYSQQLVFSY